MNVTDFHMIFFFLDFPEIFLIGRLLSFFVNKKFFFQFFVSKKFSFGNFEVAILYIDNFVDRYIYNNRFRENYYRAIYLRISMLRPHESNVCK